MRCQVCNKNAATVHVTELRERPDEAAPDAEGSGAGDGPAAESPGEPQGAGSQAGSSKAGGSKTGSSKAGSSKAGASKARSSKAGSSKAESKQTKGKQAPDDQTRGDGSPGPRPGGGPHGRKYLVAQKHICEGCAQMMNLAHLPIKKKQMVDIWKLLQKSAQRSKREGGLTCKDCGMTLGEFRSRGRLGCANCYDSFQRHLDPLLERIHNSVRHTGRIPGLDEATRERRERIQSLRRRLEAAIREEAYEDAAHLRDALQALEAEE